MAPSDLILMAMIIIIMEIKFFILAFLLANNVVFLHAQPSHGFTTFVFGDSLVDAGNNDYLFTLSKADFHPYGIDFVASGGQPTGRFTNGRTISDIVGQQLGAKTFPPPYLSSTTELSNATDVGINYASGAAGIFDQTGAMFIGRISLKKQIIYFEETRRQMVNEMGEEKTKEMLKEAMFSITMGSNDVLNYVVQKSIPFLPNKVTPSTLQDFMISNLTIHLKRLHGHGARKLVVVGIGPLGCIPFVRRTMLVPVGCSASVNSLVRGYNQKLQAKIVELNKELGPEAMFVYANSYDVVREIISNHQSYGFVNGEDPCCGGVFPPFNCYVAKKASMSGVVCSERSKYVFWDAYHPTEAANIVIAAKFMDGDQSFTYPINIRQLHNYHFNISPTP